MKGDGKNFFYMLRRYRHAGQVLRREFQRIHILRFKSCKNYNLIFLYKPQKFGICEQVSKAFLCKALGCILCLCRLLLSTETMYAVFFLYSLLLALWEASLEYLLFYTM
jgi:hypothetical protein